MDDLSSEEMAWQNQQRVADFSIPAPPHPENSTQPEFPYIRNELDIPYSVTNDGRVLEGRTVTVLPEETPVLRDAGMPTSTEVLAAQHTAFPTELPGE